MSTNTITFMQAIERLLDLWEQATTNQERAAVRATILLVCRLPGCDRKRLASAWPGREK